MTALAMLIPSRSVIINEVREFYLEWMPVIRLDKIKANVRIEKEDRMSRS